MPVQGLGARSGLLSLLAGAACSGRPSDAGSRPRHGAWQAVRPGLPASLPCGGFSPPFWRLVGRVPGATNYTSAVLSPEPQGLRAWPSAQHSSPDTAWGLSLFWKLCTDVPPTHTHTHPQPAALEPAAGTSWLGAGGEGQGGTESLDAGGKTTEEICCQGPLRPGRPELRAVWSLALPWRCCEAGDHNCRYAREHAPHAP